MYCARLQRTTLNTTEIGRLVMPKCYAFALSPSLYEGNGDGGIRTLGSLLGYGALAKRCFRRLSHINKNSPAYREEMTITHTDLRRVLAVSSELLLLHRLLE